LCAATIRDLRRNRFLAPGGVEFAGLLRALLPLVYGHASSHFPDHAASAANVTAATFQALAMRWRRLPRRTVVATWLLQTAGYAAQRESRRLKLPPPVTPSAASWNRAFWRRFVRLPRTARDALVLGDCLRLNVEETARALRRKEARVLKEADRGLAKLAKRLRKRGPATDPRAFLQGLLVVPPPEIESRSIDRLVGWTPRQGKDDLLRGVLWSWRWTGLRLGLKRALATVGTIVLILAMLAGSVAWLARQGHLTAWFIRQANRQLVKEVPEIAQPARPWPGTVGAASAAANVPPRTAAELYGLTNIWSAMLSFTAEQWKGMEPSRVRPVPNIMKPDGTLELRNPNAKRSGLAGVLGIEFNWVGARFDFAGSTYANVAVRYRGNGTYLNSLFGPKQSFKIDLNRFQKGQSLAGIRTLNFVNAIPDNSYLRDAMAQALFRDLGVPGPRTAYAYLTLDVPGKFAQQPLGLYVLIENLDGDFAAERLGSKQAPVFKPVTTDLFRDLGADWQAYADIYDLKTKATPEQLQRVIAFARLVTHADDTEFAQRLPEFLDLDEFAAFLAGHVLISSYDGFLSNGQNFYMYLDPRSNRLGFIAWDQDHSWGEFGYIGTADRRERASIWQPSTYRNRFLDRVLKVEAFRALYRQTLERAVASVFTVEHLYPRIDRLAAAIRPAVAAESDFRLKRFDLSVSTNWIEGPRDGAPEGPKAPVHQIKRFIVNRVASVRDQLAGKTEGVVLRGWERRQ
jgi:DNA-directed RNA polymerase specialized sigma24 family protein